MAAMVSILQRLGLRLHPKKTRMVNLSWGKEGFEFLGHHLRKMPSYRFAGKWFLNRWPSQKSMKRLREKIKAIVNSSKNGVRHVSELVVKLNPILRGWANYFRSGNASRQFAQMQKYVWERMARFECKRRKRTAPYRDPRYDVKWYQSLGLEKLTGTTKYSNPSLVLAKASCEWFSVSRMIEKVTYGLKGGYRKPDSIKHRRLNSTNENNPPNKKWT